MSSIFRLKKKIEGIKSIMANHYKANAALLEKTTMGKIILKYLDTVPENREKVKKIDGVLQFEVNGKYYLMHSKEERKEAEYLLQQIDPDRDYLLVVYGIGNLSLIEQLLQYTSENTKILIIEENVYIFRYRMYYDRLDKVMKNKKVLFTLGDSQIFALALRVCIQSEWSNLAYNTKVITLPNYQVYRKELNAKVQMISEGMTTDIYALGNSLEDMMSGVTNNYLNVDSCITSNSIKELSGKYKGMPGIVVAAGPSLDKNIQFLKEAEGKAVIIACDASYETCIRHGVKPDAIASIEREIPTYNCFYKGKTFDDDLVFLGPGLVWKDILTEFPGKKILMAKTPEGADGWWMKHFDNMEFVVMGFSCANVAHAVLEEAGCNPIILIGQDLAYTDDKQHNEEAHENFGGDNRINTNAEYLWTEDIYGKPVRTSLAFNLFRSYFERSTERNVTKLIDATEGGAKIAGTEIMTFKEAIDKYCVNQKEKSMTEYLKDIPWDNQKAIDKYKEIIVSAKELIATVEELEEMMRTHVRKIAKYQDFDFEHASEEDLVNCIYEMQEGNRLIPYVTEKNQDLATFYGHIYKVAIMNVKKLGNSVNGETVKKNWEIQARLIYLMQIVSKTVKEKYEELIGFMEDKIEKVKKDMVK